MKNIILSADGPKRVYSVPDKIAEHLDDTCWYFRSFWIFDEPQCKKFVQNGIAHYNDRDFIDYLNNWEMPEFESVLIEELGYIEQQEIPEKYQSCPQYNF